MDELDAERERAGSLCEVLLSQIHAPAAHGATQIRLGAAILAAVGAGLVDDLDAAAGLWNLEREFLPAMEPERRESLLKGWRAAVARTLL